MRSIVWSWASKPGGNAELVWLALRLGQCDRPPTKAPIGPFSMVKLKPRGLALACLQPDGPAIRKRVGDSFCARHRMPWSNYIRQKDLESWLTTGKRSAWKMAWPGGEAGRDAAHSCVTRFTKEGILAHNLHERLDETSLVVCTWRG